MSSTYKGRHYTLRSFAVETSNFAHLVTVVKMNMPRKLCGKCREKSAVESSVTQDLEIPVAENP